MPRGSFGLIQVGYSTKGREWANENIKKEKVILYLFKPVSGYSSKLTEFVVIKEANENCCRMTTPLNNSFTEFYYDVIRRVVIRRVFVESRLSGSKIRYYLLSKKPMMF